MKNRLIQIDPAAAKNPPGSGIARSGFAAKDGAIASYETARLSSTFANNYQTDIDDQQSLYGFANENYAYDEIGNLIKDRSEKIANIEWTVYGKVKKVQRNPVVYKLSLAL